MAQQANRFLSSTQLGLVGGNIAGNIYDSAQSGIGPQLANLDGACPLVIPHAQIHVINTPTIFQYVPNMAKFAKTLFERHATRVDGIDPEYTMDYVKKSVGFDGQQQAMPAQNKRTQLTPSFTFPEVTGNAVWRFILTWLRLMKDPDTQAAFTNTLIQNSGATILPQVQSDFSMSILVIIPDTTRVAGNIIDGYILTNMMPQSTGPAGYKRDVSANEESPDRTINFECVLQHNDNTYRLAQQYMQMIGAHRVDYNYAPVADTLSAALQNLGIQLEVATDVANFTPRTLLTPGTK